MIRIDTVGLVISGRAVGSAFFLGSIFFVFLSSSITASAQEGLDAYERGRLGEAWNYLQAGAEDPDEADFLRAALTTNADSALVIYRQIVLRNPESTVAKRSLDRIRQYYSAQGLYTRADEIGKTLGDWKLPQRRLRAPESTPPPPFALSPGVFPPILRQVPDEEGPTAEEPDTSAPPAYSLQIGAFSSSSNAQALKDKLQRAGYEVVVLDPEQNEANLYVVRVVGYGTIDEAFTAAQEIQQKFKLKPIVVPGEGRN